MEQIAVFLTREELEEVIADIEFAQEIGDEDTPAEEAALEKMRAALTHVSKTSGAKS